MDRPPPVDHPGDSSVEVALAAFLPGCLLIATLACAVLLPATLAFHYNHAVEEAVPPYETTHLRNALDECVLQDGALLVNGWAYLEQEPGIRPIVVYATDSKGTVLRIPSRVEHGQDLAGRAGRMMEQDAVRAGFSAASSRAGKLVPPIAISILRSGRDGRLHGATHACG